MAKDAFSNPALHPYAGPVVGTFTVNGMIYKTLFLLLIMAVTFGYSWAVATSGYHELFSTQAVENKLPDAIPMSSAAVSMASLGLLGAFFVGMFVIFNQGLAPYLTPVYAALEGLGLGGISAMFEAKYPGIVLQAMTGVAGVFLSVLLVHRAGWVQPTLKFRMILLAAMLGILFLYLTDLVLVCFGSSVPIVHDNSWKAIGLQILICGVASLCFISDFGDIADAAEEKAPAWYEWYAGFSLLVTVVWLYVEILRLVAKVRKR